MSPPESSSPLHVLASVNKLYRPPSPFPVLGNGHSPPSFKLLLQSATSPAFAFLSHQMAPNMSAAKEEPAVVSYRTQTRRKERPSNKMARRTSTSPDTSREVERHRRRQERYQHLRQEASTAGMCPNPTSSHHLVISSSAGGMISIFALLTCAAKLQVRHHAWLREYRHGQLGDSPSVRTHPLV